MLKIFQYSLLLILSCSDYNLSAEQEKNLPPSPVIQVTPESLELTNIDAGCELTEEIIIKNIGTGLLEVINIEYFITLPVNFTYELNETENGELPWELAPDDTKTFSIDYTPSDDLGDSAFIQIDSNDMSSPTTVFTNGLANYHAWVTDEFEQETLTDIDILFVIDNSGSMRNIQTNIANNFDIFINIFAASGVDYHIAFITTDSPDFVGEQITPLFLDPIQEANSQISAIGTLGSPNEVGIEMSYEALRGAGDAAPGSEFFREDAKLVIIYVSDEDDQGSISPIIASTYFSTLKQSSSSIATHAVIGDVPGGCPSAQPGELYSELVQQMNGTELSICSADWGTPMEQLAVESMINNTFYLSDSNPVVETIEVLVDSIAVFDWTYDSVYNAITFGSSSIPSDGQLIALNYAIYGQCP